MAVIGITLNEVLRDFLGQFNMVYDKYLTPVKQITEEEVTSFELMNHYPFEKKIDLHRFMYNEASLEIFGHADQLTDGLINRFNNFLMTIRDEEEHTVEITSQEIDKSIPSTLFFLSKTGCKCPTIRFVTDIVDVWDGVDLLITADPRALENKPEGKLSVKINTRYNTEVQADYSLDSIVELFNDASLRDTIFKTKIITYENL